MGVNIVTGGEDGKITVLRTNDLQPLTVIGMQITLWYIATDYSDSYAIKFPCSEGLIVMPTYHTHFAGGYLGGEIIIYQAHITRLT